MSDPGKDIRARAAGMLHDDVLETRAMSDEWSGHVTKPVSSAVPVPVNIPTTKDGWREAYIAVVAEKQRIEARLSTAEEALRKAHDHLRFNAWEDDPNSDKRVAAVQEIEAALQPDHPTSGPGFTTVTGYEPRRSR